MGATEADGCDTLVLALQAGAISPPATPKRRRGGLDEGPGGAAVVVGVGEALVEEAAAAVGDRLDLDAGEQVGEPVAERPALEFGEAAADVIGELVGDALAREIPDHGAQLPGRVEREAVVDADDHIVDLVVQAVATLAVGVVGED